MYETVTSRYERYLTSRRERLLSQATGRVVEIGPGCGANLPYYGKIESWTGIEANPSMRKRLTPRLPSLAVPTEVIAGRAEQLPMANESVDSVVSTLVLCSVHSVDQSLQEIMRVLRPGGRFFFLEHIAAPRHTFAYRTQCLLRGPWSICADGCQLNRDLLGQIQAMACSDFDIETWQAPYPPVPFFLSPHIMGTAIK